MDAEAQFRALFLDAYPALRRYALHRGLSPADTDDLVAEVFTVAWRRIGDVPDDAMPWLFGVARNVLRNMRRSDRRATSMLSRLPRPDVQHPEEPDHHAVDAVRRALGSLSERDRELLILVAWDDLTPQQAAVAIGAAPGVTRVRLHRARERFAAALHAAETTTTDRTRIHREPVGREVPDVCT